MPETRKWTFMVYMAGDNDLDAAGLVDLREMKKVGSGPALNVVAQFDSAHDHRTRRYFVQKGTPLAADQVKDLGRTNCGDPAVLEAFLTWATKTYPAEHYALVVWNHGNGWDDEDVYRLATDSLTMTIARRDVVAIAGGPRRLPVAHARRLTTGPLRRALFATTIQRAVRLRGIAYDDHARDFLDNLELKGVLQRVTASLGRPLDLLGMDACLMSMAEVLYELRDTAQVSVASEQTEPGDGWPYDKVLLALAATPAMTAQELGKVVVQKYLAAYGARSNVTQTACDLARCADLARAIDALGQALLSYLAVPTVRAAVLEARKDVQSYERDDYVDLQDLCDLLEAGCPEPAVKAACAQARAAVQACVIENGWKGDEVANSHGVAVYFPRKKVSALYRKLDLASATTWDDFLALYLQRAPVGAGFRAAPPSR